MVLPFSGGGGEGNTTAPGRGTFIEPTELLSSPPDHWFVSVSERNDLIYKVAGNPGKGIETCLRHRGSYASGQQF